MTEACPNNRNHDARRRTNEPCNPDAPRASLEPSGICAKRTRHNQGAKNRLDTMASRPTTALHFFPSVNVCCEPTSHTLLYILGALAMSLSMASCRLMHRSDKLICIAPLLCCCRFFFGLHDVARSSPMAALNLSCPERASNARRFFRMTLPTAHADFDGL